MFIEQSIARVIMGLVEFERTMGSSEQQFVKNLFNLLVGGTYTAVFKETKPIHALITDSIAS